MINNHPRLVITAGEPAGIGPDLVVYLAQHAWPAELVVCGDPQLLLNRAARLALPLSLRDYNPMRVPQPQGAGTLTVLPVTLPKREVPGTLDPSNSPYVLEILNIASDGCLRGEFAALITGPIHKGVINDAGYSFSGHTEYLAQRAACTRVVMLLVAEPLRVALATTHLPLSKVPEAITVPSLTETITLLTDGLQQWFGIETPHIYVCGLNPHAGEGGYLGGEELTIIGPALEKLRAAGLRLTGPLPADTLFQPHHLQHADAVLAMYHDQGLPVLKHYGFGRAVNLTFGLPFIRTSVDHGTALALAGRGGVHTGSVFAALRLALKLIERLHG